jgi:hypothetical protein
MASFRGLYDKLVSYILDTSKVDTYEPVSEDYVAVYNSNGPRNLDDDATWMPKKYVPVTSIGSGEGSGLETVTFNGVGGIEFSLSGNIGSYETTQTIDTTNNTIYLDFTSVPNGLTWTGTFNNATNYTTNDVVSWVDLATNIYYTYWATTPINAGAGDPDDNQDWVLLGSQGPQGIQGPPNAIATAGFVQKTANYTIQASSAYGTANNDCGKIIVVKNDTNNEVVITIPANLNTTNFPPNNQVTIVNESDVNTFPQSRVRIAPASGVNLYSSDNARYLRTQYSSASIVRGHYSTGSANESYWMFGDLTNIA